MSNLTINDYKKILNFYKKPIPLSKRLLKRNAERIMSEKLCRCIKKIDSKYEARSIGICTKTIFNSKNYTRGPFTCTGKQKITIKRMSTKNKKTRKNRKM